MKLGPRFRVLNLAAFAAIAVLSIGCRTVEPWERGQLAQGSMNPDRDPLRNALEEHMLFSREAASGGRGIGGGGCGCN